MKGRREGNQELDPMTAPASIPSPEPEAFRLPWSGPPVGLFWDQSLVWGLLCVETLQRLRVPFRLLSARDIGRGALEGRSLLLVPGGWAAHKVRALGEVGRERIRAFVEGGGSYLGFCGGAGLALSSPPALSLVPLERMPLGERLPSASGEVWIEGLPHHPAWENLPPVLPTSVWWPSQFWGYPLPRCLCLATYRFPGRDFRVADMAVSDVTDRDMVWEEWEKIYGINLDPRRFLGHPALLEVRVGRGRLLLSYPHLETPGDPWGNRLFANLLTYLDARGRAAAGAGELPRRVEPPEAPSPGEEARRVLAGALDQIEDLICFGERNLLWKWRNSWLLSWQRGIRGLEYGSLAVCLRALEGSVQGMSGSPVRPDPWLEPLQALEAALKEFCPSARKLLLEEKAAMNSGRVSKLGQVNRTVDALRNRLFGPQMNHGGLCAEIFNRLDRLLMDALGGPASPAGWFPKMP
ncbi:MAG TPA: BPL-N domain-containing protein [Syntrophobacteraceae bacterium]|nr:BPL-N domain-containing protein [Syntrophobacteraceae bacterium]